MLGINWYHELTKKYVTIFGTLFDDIVITRFLSDGTPTQVLKVPITFAPKDKVLTRIIQDADLDRKSAIVLPMMAFEYTYLPYDSNRKLNTVGKIVRKSDDPNTLKFNYNPVPYNYAFSLYVYVKNMEDGTKIIEQILPMFKPDLTVSAHLIPEMDIIMDIPITLENITIQDSYDGSFTDRRAIIYTLEFTLKGYLYGPVREKPIIKFVKSHFYASTNSNTAVETITVKPGLDANGDPTSIESDSIDVNEIWADDDYGFITKYE
mgnify:CR=1 FL=1